jgi:hypothetical protein
VSGPRPSGPWSELFRSSVRLDDLADNLLLTIGFLGQCTVRVKALQLALRTTSAALVPRTHAFDGVLGLPGRTAKQIALSSSWHTNCSAKQGLVLEKKRKSYAVRRDNAGTRHTA